ncbi:MAG: substrate-binding domain-containing protein [Verrucomicrobia bacterium]|nr:substrate-binding domain-containing protein [Verrucomicrobiota bacterium]
MQIPLRSSLVEQALAILRREILSGRWGQRMPPERELGERLKISRPTVRAALAVLQREGLIQVTWGQRRHIRPRPARSRCRAVSRVISVLYMAPQEIATPFSVLLFKELEHALHAGGYEMDLHSDARFNDPHPEPRLESLTRENQAACWLLLASSVRVQHWFMHRPIPAFVVGSRHADIRLPSFDLNYRAICRHAVQVLWKMGHRRIVLVTSRSGLAGDLSSEQGFREAFRQLSGDKVAARVAHHDETVTGIRQLLDAEWSRKTVPTAVLVSRSTHALTVFSHLVKRGLDVPRDVSLISRDDDEFLAHLIPAFARYVVNWKPCLRRISRSVLLLARSGALKPRETLYIPEFYKGESVAPPR